MSQSKEKLTEKEQQILSRIDFADNGTSRGRAYSADDLGFIIGNVDREQLEFYLSELLRKGYVKKVYFRIR